MIWGLSLRLFRSKHCYCTPFVWIFSRKRVNVDVAACSLQYKRKRNGGCYEHAGIAEGLTKPVTVLMGCFMLR